MILEEKANAREYWTWGFCPNKLNYKSADTVLVEKGVGRRAMQGVRCDQWWQVHKVLKIKESLPGGIVLDQVLQTHLQFKEVA